MSRHRTLYYMFVVQALECPVIEPCMFVVEALECPVIEPYEPVSGTEVFLGNNKTQN